MDTLDLQDPPSIPPSPVPAFVPVDVSKMTPQTAERILRQELAHYHMGYAIGIMGHLTGLGANPLLAVREVNIRDAKLQAVKQLWGISGALGHLNALLWDHAMTVLIDLDHLNTSCLIKDPKVLDLQPLHWKKGAREKSNVWELLNGWHRFLLIQQYLIPQQLENISVLDLAITQAAQGGRQAELDSLANDRKKNVRSAKKKATWSVSVYDKSKFSSFKIHQLLILI